MNYDIYSYLKETKKQNIKESFNKIDKLEKRRFLKEQNDKIFKTSKRLVNLYLNEKKDPTYIVEKVIKNLSNNGYNFSKETIRGMVYETLIPSKMGENYSKLSLNEKASYKASLYKIKRSYPKNNLVEYFYEITKNISSRMGVDG